VAVIPFFQFTHYVNFRVKFIRRRKKKEGEKKRRKGELGVKELERVAYAVRGGHVSENQSRGRLLKKRRRKKKGEKGKKPHSSW